MYKEELEEFKQRRRDILDIYEAGVNVPTIAETLNISRARVYQLINHAKKDREKEIEREAMEVNQ